MSEPDKLYLNKDEMHPAGRRKLSLYRTSDADVEYIRTDVFVEKAKKWLDDNFFYDNRSSLVINGTYNSMKDMFDDLEKAVKL